MKNFEEFVNRIKELYVQYIKPIIFKIEKAHNQIVGTIAAPGQAVVGTVEKVSEGGAGTAVNIAMNLSGITDRTDKRNLAREIGNMIQQEVARKLGGSVMSGRF